MPKYKIADTVFNADNLHSYSLDLCKDYLYDGEEEPEFGVTITEKDLQEEEKIAGDVKFSKSYLESLSLFRKLCDYLILHKEGTVFHCSAVKVGNLAYLFTAPSGTGKSTHARLWRETFGDKVVMINDDKPIIRCIDGEFFVYGTPWNGKHRLSNNIKVKIGAICELKRGEKNSIEKVPAKDMLITVMKQTLRPSEERMSDKMFSLLNKLLNSVEFYRLYCNISKEAAITSYNAMVKENEK